jgi:hypothetical protein
METFIVQDMVQSASSSVPDSGAKWRACQQLSCMPFNLAEGVEAYRYFDLVPRQLPSEDKNSYAASKITTSGPVHLVAPETPSSDVFRAYDVKVVETPEAKWCIVSARERTLACQLTHLPIDCRLQTNPGQLHQTPKYSGGCQIRNWPYFLPYCLLIKSEDEDEGAEVTRRNGPHHAHQPAR